MALEEDITLCKNINARLDKISLLVEKTKTNISNDNMYPVSACSNLDEVASELTDLQELNNSQNIEPDPNDFRTGMIKMLNEEFGKLNDHELGKVYKFRRTKLIAGL